ncbi:MAG: dihydrofolate reductase [Planctomycetes bacterium]|nr:dihydrofolate reductase [Planctomycetota bacterium]
MILTIVVAVDENGLIGRDGDLPWRLPADLAHFKRTTMGKPIVMGRKTWESIGRPLPGRTNVVISRDPAFRAEGALVLHDPAEVADRLADHEEVCIIGGAEIYRLFLPLCRRIELTRVHAEIEGDTWFPPLDPAQWHEIAREERAADEKNAHPMTFITLERRS